jgi:hypothetical protein
MYEKDGIVYAGDYKHLPKIIYLRAMDDYKLLVHFASGEIKTFDVKPFLDKPVFKPLKTPEIFSSVSLQYGAPVWCNGDVDIDPEVIFEDGING